MSILKTLENILGDWTGQNRLWLSPKEPVRESNTRATVAIAAKGRFITIQYSWAYNGEAQEGLLLLGYEKKADVVKGVWVDSWHMNDKMMICQGEIEANGNVSVTGSYAAPPGPDWGWRIVISPEEGRAFKMIMYNIWPEGQEDLAVEATYT